MKKVMKVIYPIAIVLLVVGGLNWGLVGLLNLDVVAALFGAGSIIASIIYVLVGLSALFVVLSRVLKKKK